MKILVDRRKFSRYGAYGVAMKESHILLTKKKSGLYKGLWGLPGGKIEFGEHPEETLKRELMEESALELGELKLLSIAKVVGMHEDEEGSYQFHHLGILYKICSFQLFSGKIPEEENGWFSLNGIAEKELTPFAHQTLKNPLFL